jgi:DNA modification methylase
MNKNNIVDLGERGKYNKRNKLNNLTGKEWIKFTKSWFIHKPKRRNGDEILHPAKYPESLVEEFISFFTKENDWVFDPFLGTGSTLIAAGNLKRNGIGIELNNKYFKICEKRIRENKFQNKLIALKGDSNNLAVLIKKENSTSEIDYTITSPPYWNQLERNSLRQIKRNNNGLDTKYSKLKEDIGNINDYEKFLEAQAKIFDQVFDFTKDKGYLTIITNNIFYKSKIFPLAYDTATSLTKRGEKSWILKDEKIWLQDDKPLIALGVNSAWVGNRHHQYCLIFRKEL